MINGVRDAIDAFKWAQNKANPLQQESFDPSNEDFHSPQFAALAADYKRVVKGYAAAHEAAAAAPEDPNAKQAVWDANSAKEQARSALLGKIHEAFPHLGHGEVLEVAARHLKQGPSPKSEFIDLLGELFRMRDNSERGISFGGAVAAARAGGFVSALKSFYPELDHTVRHFQRDGVTLVEFPGGEHMPGQPDAEDAPPPAASPEAGPAPGPAGEEKQAESVEEDVYDTLRRAVLDEVAQDVPGTGERAGGGLSQTRVGKTGRVKSGVAGKTAGEQRKLVKEAARLGISVDALLERMKLSRANKARNEALAPRLADVSPREEAANRAQSVYARALIRHGGKK